MIMMHEKDAVLQVANELSKKVLALQEDCHTQSLTNADACHRIDDIAAMARMVMADLSDAVCGQNVVAG